MNHKARNYNGHTNLSDIEKAKAYKGRSELRIHNPALYGRLNYHGLLNLACFHMKPVGNKNKRMIYALVSNEAKLAYIGLTCNLSKRIKYHTNMTQRSTVNIVNKKDFTVVKVSDYIDACDAQKLEKETVKLYKDLGYCVTNSKITGQLGGDALKYTKEKVYEKARLCSSKTEFVEKYYSYNNRAIYDGYIEKLNKDMGWKNRVKWTKCLVYEEAKKHSSPTSLKYLRIGAWSHARRNGYYEELKCEMGWGK